MSGALPSDSSPRELDVHESHEHAEDRGIAIVYSKNRYKQDAAIISVLKAELDNGGFLHLRDVWRESEAQTAQAILRIIDRRKRDKLLATALSDVHSLNTSASSAAAFQRFLNRFHDGPTEVDNEAEEAEDDQQPISSRASTMPRRPVEVLRE